MVVSKKPVQVSPTPQTVSKKLKDWVSTFSFPVSYSWTAFKFENHQKVHKKVFFSAKQQFFWLNLYLNYNQGSWPTQKQSKAELFTSQLRSENLETFTLSKIDVHTAVDTTPWGCAWWARKIELVKLPVRKKLPRQCLAE